jgi:hypothetical protein
MMLANGASLTIGCRSYAPRGANVFAVEGEGKVEALRRVGLLAITTAFHEWSVESINALAGHHVHVLADFDRRGREYAEKTVAAVAPVAASTRLVRYKHLWRHLPADKRGEKPRPHEDIKNWLEERGGDPNKLLEICLKIAPAGSTGTTNFLKAPLTGTDWMDRDLPQRDLLLGELLSTTSRALLTADTGLGKTNFGMAIAGHVGAGRDFLHWRCPCRRNILYVDGEMARRLFRERIADVLRRLHPAPTRAHFFSTEDIEDFAPLNTAEGQALLWKLIAEVERRSGARLDFIIFDSIMALLLGDMKEEDAWRDTLPLTKDLTKRRIGQLWIHHTGHDTSRGYGTKTREWQMDTVIHLDAVQRPDTDVSFALTFSKARERTPLNRADFQPINVALVNDRWESTQANVGKEKLSDGLVQKFLDALCIAAATSTVTKMNANPTAKIEEWRVACVNLGLLDGVKNARNAEVMFAKYRRKLIAANWIACNTELAWILP